VKNNTKIGIATIIGTIVGLWLALVQGLPFGRAALAAALSGLLVFALLIILKFRP
jgi:hypothetical protein